MRLILALLSLIWSLPVAAQVHLYGPSSEPNGWAVRQLANEGEPAFSTRTVDFNNGQLYLFNSAQSAPFTLNIPACDQPVLPTPADFTPQWSVTFKDVNNGIAGQVVTLQPASGLINGKSNFPIDTPSMTVEVQWTGSRCFAVAGFRPTMANQLVFPRINGTADVFTEVAATQLTSDLALSVKSTSAFPTEPPFAVVTGDESQLVTAYGVPDTTMVVERGFRSTPILQHEIGETVVLGRPGSRLNGAITNVQPTLTVNSEANFPNVNGFPWTVDSEIGWCSANCTTLTWTVLRNQFGTAASAHGNGALVTALMRYATLASAIGPGDVTMTVTDNTNLPKVCPFMLRADSESIRVDTGCAGTSYGITRAMNATTAASHAAGAPLISPRHQCRTLPRNAYLLNMLVLQNNGGGPTRVDVGTAPGLFDVLADYNVPDLGRAVATPLINFFSNTAETQICATQRTMWGDAALTMRAPFVQNPGTQVSITPPVSGD